MGTVGRILKNMGLLKEVTEPTKQSQRFLVYQIHVQAQLLLQRNLELYESHSDPDSSDVANAMCDLASLYLADNRYRYKPSYPWL